MSIVSEIQQRLAAISPAVFREIGGAADFAAIVQAPRATPAAFVLIEEESSSENERMTGPVLQRTELDVAVVIVTRNVAGDRAAAAATEIEGLKAAVRTALVGFVPTTSQDRTPLTHLSGSMVKAAAGTVWWRELYAAATYTMEA